MSSNNKVNVALDFAKFFASVVVVAIHTNAFKDINTDFYNFCSYCVFAFAVPFFFICSGYLLGKKVDRASLPTEYRGVIKNYSSRLLYPYLIWGAWYFIVVSALNVIKGDVSPISSVFNQLHSWIVSSPGGGLWYIQAALMILVLLYFDGKKEHIRIYTIVAFFLSLIPSVVDQLKNNAVIFERIETTYNKMFLTDLNFIWWGVYFLIGLSLAMYGGNVIEKLSKHRMVWFALSYATYVFIYFMFGKSIILQAMKIFVSIIIFITILTSKLNIKSEISVVFRKMSTIIYFTHFTFIYFVQVLFKLLGIDYGTHLTLAWVVCSAIVIVYSFIMAYPQRNPLMQLYERKRI